MLYSTCCNGKLFLVCLFLTLVQLTCQADRFNKTTTHEWHHIATPYISQHHSQWPDTRPRPPARPTTWPHDHTGHEYGNSPACCHVTSWYAGHRSAHACILSSCLTHLLIQLFRGCLEDWLCAFSFGIACTSYSRSPGPAMRECWSALKTPSCMYVCICQSENGYGSELCIVLLVGHSSGGSLVTRTSWAAYPDISSALASGEFLVLLLIACKLVGGMLADISTQVLHLDGSENALAMTQ